MNILFDTKGYPIPRKHIETCVREFGQGYRRTVQDIIARSQSGITRDIFFHNVAQLMPNFKMTRRGCFKGVKYHLGVPQDPNGQIDQCWAACGHDVLQIRTFLAQQPNNGRRRIIADIPIVSRGKVIIDLRRTFNLLIPVCMGKVANGLVASSKVLFAALPEIAMPIDTIQWRKLFKTIDYGDIIALMADEIMAWEKQTGQFLDSCDPYPDATLPSIYNVMAMKARP
jgi:hypothetical protein